MEVLNVLDVLLVGLIMIGIFAYIKNEVSVFQKICGYVSFGFLIFGLMIKGENGEVMIRLGVFFVCLFLLFVYQKRANFLNIQ